ncbi:ABC transporter ATP-binding protein [Dongia sedimenti]|uniref:ABC transporter ATP-binding protein n=1 Tax=Dongia sedimenti TaxID=3064282 RepID=A0ABU0YWV3_9PROT|nr:ABC transporter ATP-binding protein [Rhodospirillaceae bacterium R-7]
MTVQRHPATSTVPGARDPLLSVKGLSVLLFTETATVRAVTDVAYTVHRGETLAIVGESGSGKTVMNLAPLGLMPGGVRAVVSGSVRLSGEDLTQASEDRLMQVRGRKVGVVFQDPLSALNPNRRVGPQIEEVFRLRLGLDAAASHARAIEFLRMVGIPEPERRLRMFPHEMSGGMRQRVMIAIAIAAEPELLIADEPTTALDVTIQSQLLELLMRLQKQLGMAMVLVTHDVGVVARVADRVAVMYAGEIVELGTAEEILKRPRHPYTRALLAAVPEPDAPVGSRFTGLSGSPPDLSNPAVGCAFAPRCPLVQGECTRATPMLTQAEGSGHLAACWVSTPQVAERPTR